MAARGGWAAASRASGVRGSERVAYLDPAAGERIAHWTNLIAGETIEQAAGKEYHMASDTIWLELPAEILDAAKMTPDELRVELAVSLYQRGRLGFSKAREVTGLTVWEFRQLLGSRKIPVHYDEADLQDDLHTLRQLI